MSEKTTSDIYLAAAFLASGAKLEKTDRTDPRHMEFTFSAPLETTVKVTPPAGSPPSANDAPILTTITGINLDTIETQWVNKKLDGNLFEFAEAIKRMKSVVHSR